MNLRKLGRENWVPDESVTNCFLCFSEFGMLRRRHHCRACGNIFCFRCSNKRIYYTPGTRENEPGYVQKQKRVCNACFSHISEAWKDAAAIKKKAEIARKEAEQLRNEALALRSAKEALEIQLDNARALRDGDAPPPPDEGEAPDIQLDHATAPLGDGAPLPDTIEESLEIQLDSARVPHSGGAPPPDETEANESSEIQLDSARAPHSGDAPPPEETEEAALDIQLDSPRAPPGADAPPPDESGAKEPLELQLDSARAPHGGDAPPPDESEALEVQPDNARAPHCSTPSPDKSEAPATPENVKLAPATPEHIKLDIEIELRASDGEINTLYDRIALFRRRVADMERELEEAHRRSSPPLSPQPESEPRSTPRGGPGVYLIFEVIQYGTLSIVWSKCHVEGALAYGEPGIRVPEFKYAGGGKCELYRELACNTDKFYAGWTMFGKICRQFRCTVTVFGKSERSVPVPIRLWLHSKEKNGVQKVVPDEAFTMDGVDVITATHRDNNDLLVSRMDRRTFVEKSRSIGHFVAFDAGR